MHAVKSTYPDGSLETGTLLWVSHPPWSVPKKQVPRVRGPDLTPAPRGRGWTTGGTGRQLGCGHWHLPMCDFGVPCKLSKLEKMLDKNKIC